MMTSAKRLLLALSAMLLILPAATRAQDADEDGAIVAEELLIEEAVDGADAAADIAIEDIAIEDIAIEDIALDDIAVEDVAVEEPADVMIEDVPVEDVAIETEEEKGIPQPDVAVEDVMVEAAPAADAVEEMQEAAPAEVDDLDAIVAKEFEDALNGGVPAPPDELLDAVNAAAEPVVEDAPEIELVEEAPAIEIVEEPPAAEVVQEEPAVEVIEDVPAIMVEEEPAVEVIEDVPAIMVEEEPAVEIVEDVPAIMVEEEPVVEVVQEEAPAVEEAPVVDIGLGDLVDDVAVEEPMENLDEPVADVTETPAPVVVEEPVAEAQPEPVVVEEPVDPRMVELDRMINREEIRRKALEAHGLESLKRGKRALGEENFKDSTQSFEEALRYIIDRQETRKYREEAREGLADSYYGWSQMLMDQKDFDAADDMARRAQAHGHKKAGELILEIADRRQGEKVKPPPPPTKRWREKDFKDHEETIAKNLRRARQHMLVGEHAQAEEVLDGVLVLDPENLEAIRLLHKSAIKKYDRSSMELDATRTDMMAAVRDTWNPRNREFVGIPQEGKQSRGQATIQQGSGGDRLRIIQKMENIIVPEIDFRQANIHDVVEFLQEASVEFDPEKDPLGRKGVNIILHIGEGGTATPMVSSDPFADAIEDVGLGNAGGIPLITFNARYISLFEALKIVTKVADLKFRIEGSVVMIVPLNAPEGEIHVRTYNVLPTVEEKISTVGTELGGGMGGSDDFRTLDSSGVGVEGQDWKKFFDEMGVAWPEGSSIRYVRSIGKLVVANTADNLTIFEQVLNELNVTPRQIEIEARFVEVAQTDLDSLGFEWQLTDDWEIAAKQGQAGVLPGGQQRIVMNANASGGGFTKGLRFAGTDGVAGTPIADDIMSLASVLTNPELTLVMHMLQQKGNTDLLSAPKVTTKSGQEAMIKVVTEYIYPTEFTVTPITATAQGGSGTAQIVGGVVEPGGFEVREVGVILSVLPEVSQEGEMINLTMTPEVVSEPEWYEYGSVYTDANGNEQRLNMQQPFFHSRTVSTSISIYNGATVVMGGMITEAREEVDDKIPFLGDIPVVGRLFRSRYDHSAKRNLLIFVTARLVDPAGRALLRNRDSGPSLTGIAEKMEGAAQEQGN